MVKVPCRNCSDRHYLCHGDCSKYAAYKAELERLKELERQEHLGDNITRMAWQKDWSMVKANSG